MKIIILALTLGACALVAAPGGRYQEQPEGKVLYLKSGTHQEPNGKVLYLKNCRQCHGATGDPSEQTKHKYPKIKTLTDDAFLSARSDDSLVAVMKKGAGRDMKSFSEKLTPEQMAAIAKFVRSLNKGSS